MVLVNGLDAWVENSEDRGEPRAGFLTRQRYAPGVIAPEQAALIESFGHEPWPTWTYRLQDGSRIEQEIFVPTSTAAAVIRWRASAAVREDAGGAPASSRAATIHALHHANPAFRFEARDGGRAGELDALRRACRQSAAAHNGEYRARAGVVPQLPLRRGARPRPRLRGGSRRAGSSAWDLSAGRRRADPERRRCGARPGACDGDVRPPAPARARRRRGRLGPPLQRAADAYLVRRGAARPSSPAIPGSPTGGATRSSRCAGSASPPGRSSEARDRSCCEWAGAGLARDAAQPLRRTTASARVQLGRRVALVRRRRARLPAARRRRRAAAVPDADRRARERRARHPRRLHAGHPLRHPRSTADGLLAAGEPGRAAHLDGRQGGRLGGHPAHRQAGGDPGALAQRARDRRGVHARLSADRSQRGLRSFRGALLERGRGCLYDVVDADHQPGTADPTFRPNQIFAVGGLPYPAARRRAAPERVVDAVEARLWTPLGLRDARSRTSPVFAALRGRRRARATAPTTRARSGPGCSARSSRRGCGCAATRADARQRGPAALSRAVARHLDEAGLGHISEIADAEPPHTPRRLSLPGVVGGRGAAARARGTARRPRERARRNTQAASTASPLSVTAAARRRHWPEYADGGRAARDLHDLRVPLHGAAVLSRLAGAPGGSRRRSCAALLIGLAMGATAVVADLLAPGGSSRGRTSIPAATLTFYRLGKVRRRGRARLYRRPVRGRGGWRGLAGALLGRPAGRRRGALRRRPAPARPGWPSAFLAEVVISSSLDVGDPAGLESRDAWPGYTGLCAGAPGGDVHHHRGAALRHEHESGADRWAPRCLGARLDRPLDLLHRPAAGHAGWRPSCISAPRRSAAVFCAKLHHQNAKRCIFCEARRPAPRAEPFRAPRHYSPPHDTNRTSLPLTLEGE